MILHTLLDYDTLRFIWWALIGVLLVGFAVTDGFDLGSGMLKGGFAGHDAPRTVFPAIIGRPWAPPRRKTTSLPPIATMGTRSFAGVPREV